MSSAGESGFWRALEEAVSERGRYIDTQPQRLRPTEIRDAYARAERRILILDYDGTLVPFAKRPEQASPPTRILDLLSALASEPQNCVALMSGRSAENLDRWFGRFEVYGWSQNTAPNLSLHPRSTWESLRPEVPTDWKSTVMPILEHFVDRTPGSFVEEKKYGLVWHYRMADPEFGEWLANELVSMLEAMLAETELRAFRGEKIVEVKPVWANKGEVSNVYWPHAPIPILFLQRVTIAQMKTCLSGSNLAPGRCTSVLDPLAPPTW